MVINTNTKLVTKLLLGFRTGLSSILINIFKSNYLSIGLIGGFNCQIELNLNILYPFLFFCKNHSLCLFNILIDLICFEFLGSKYRYVLIYSLLNLENSLRMLIKIKIHELKNQILSLTSIFYSAG